MNNQAMREALRRIKYEACSLADAQVIALEALAQSEQRRARQEADEQQLKLLQQRGTVAWSDVKDATAWVDELRGHEEQQAEHEPEKAEQRQEPVAWRAWSDAHGYTVWETLKEAEHYSDEDHDPEPLDLRNSRKKNGGA